MSLLCAQAPGAASPPVPHLPPSAHPCRAKGAGRKSSKPAVPFLPCAPSSSWKQDTGCFVTLVLRSPGKPWGEIWHRALQTAGGLQAEAGSTRRLFVGFSWWFHAQPAVCQLGFGAGRERRGRDAPMEPKEGLGRRQRPLARILPAVPSSQPHTAWQTWGRG